MKGTILLVEDDPQLRTTFVRGLRRAGWDVVACASADEAVEELAGFERFVACLTDLSLGAEQEGGMRVVALCRAGKLPVILMSGNFGATYETLGEERLEKPFGFDVLAKLLEEMTS